MPRAKTFKLYVHKETGHLYHKPTELAGVEYTPAEYLHEVTLEQARRIDKGEPVSVVLRDGAPEEIKVDLRTKQPEPKPEPVKPPEPKPEPKPVKPPEPTEYDEIDAMSHWKQVNSFAKEKGIDFPEDMSNVEDKKEFLKKKLSE